MTVGKFGTGLIGGGFLLAIFAQGCALEEQDPAKQEQTEDALAPAAAGGLVIAGIYVSYEAVAIILTALVVTNGACALDKGCQAGVGRKIGMSVDNVGRVFAAVEGWSEDRMREVLDKALASYAHLTESAMRNCDWEKIGRCQDQCDRDIGRLASGVPALPRNVVELAGRAARAACHADCARKYCPRWDW
jgi:hypothetical protein